MFFEGIGSVPIEGTCTLCSISSQDGHLYFKGIETD